MIPDKASTLTSATNKKQAFIVEESSPFSSFKDAILSSLPDADAVIADQLNQMSSVDREKVFFDVHGVSADTVVEETPELIEKSLAELDATILADHRTREAYTMAETFNRDYVSNRLFRLQFLRAVKFDVQWAADKIIQFFEIKLGLFGPEKLVEEITLNDLDEEDLACLESGLCTILPLRDRAGRATICWTGKLRSTFSMQSRVRILSAMNHSFRTTIFLSSNCLFRFIVLRRCCGCFRFFSFELFGIPVWLS